jgi:hypothetical protein
LLARFPTRAAMDGGDAGAGALRTETDRLRRKHQRKGSEYRVRTLQGLSLGGEAAGLIYFSRAYHRVG